MSRDLDRRVAEEVMGTPEYEVVIEGCSRAGPYGSYEDAEKAIPALRKRYSVGKNPIVYSGPDYSTSISDAWEVVNKMRERGYQCEISISQKVDSYNGNTVAFSNGIVFAEEEAPTVTESICLAALAVLKAGKEGV